MDRIKSAQCMPKGNCVKYFPVLDSTNITAKEFAEKGAADGTVIQAGRQMSGRGRLGRVWESRAENGLWFSMILRPTVAAECGAQITLLTAVAVAKALQALTNNKKIAIKWPNDIMLDGKKICGILAEMQLDIQGEIEYAIVGIGINVNMSSKDFGTQLLSTATSLYLLTGIKYKREQVLGVFLDEFSRLYSQWQQDGFDDIRLKWLQYSCTLGHRVVVKDNDKEIYSGVAEDMDNYGSLLVRNAAGKIERFDFGEISIRSC